MIDWILKFITRRFVVRDRTIPMMAKYLKAFLREKRKFEKIELISDDIALVVVQEAYARAAAKDINGIARYGEFDKQIELAADQIIAAFNEESNADSRIKNILLFNRLI